MKMRYLGLTTCCAILLLQTLAWAREVEFGWEPMEGAQAYELQISTEPKFEKPLSTQKTEKPALTMNLGMGRYFYRVRVVDKKQRAGHWSAPQPVVVAPYPPELTAPKNGVDLSYFEVFPNVSFEWKPVGPDMEYDVFVYKTTGQKILEERVKGTKFTTQKLGEGEYLWKMRTIAQKLYVSNYCEPRRIQIDKTPLKAPRLIEPTDNGNSSAYHSATFKWEQDPATQFTDLTLETLASSYNAKPSKKVFENLGGSTFSVDYLEPGDYTWAIRTKEAKDTAGTGAGPQTFHARDDMITRGDFILEYGLSPTYFTIESQSNRNVPNEVHTTNTDVSKVQSVLFGYYFMEDVGIFASARTGEVSFQSHGSLNQVTDASIRIRGGVIGFSQEFIFGVRQEDMYEIYDVVYNRLGAIGPMIGTQLIGTPHARWRLVGGAQYFKASGMQENFGNLNADQYIAHLGLKFNFLDRFWLGWKMSYTRTNAVFKPFGFGNNIQSTWQENRVEPLFFTLSVEQ